jgi:hypothetical protein
VSCCSRIPILYLTPVVLFAAFILRGASVRALRKYERAVVFTLGAIGPVVAFQGWMHCDAKPQNMSPAVSVCTEDLIRVCGVTISRALLPRTSLPRMSKSLTAERVTDSFPAEETILGLSCKYDFPKTRQHQISR